eukprot:scaffold3345_cov83-Skeletonema_dohrnii-CCMP3373.AAC.6
MSARLVIIRLDETAAASLSQSANSYRASANRKIQKETYDGCGQETHSSHQLIGYGASPLASHFFPVASLSVRSVDKQPSHQRHPHSSSKANEDEDLGALIYRESQLREESAAAAKKI